MFKFLNKKYKKYNKNEIYDKKTIIRLTKKNQDLIYPQLIKNISRRTDIKEKIIYNLLKMDLINLIMNIELKTKKNVTLIEVPEKIILKDNYKTLCYYVIANFNIYYPEYTLKNEYIDSILYNKEKKSIINLNHTYFGNLFNISFDYQLNDVLPYDINLLNNEEIKELKKELSQYEKKLPRYKNQLMYVYTKENKKQISYNLSLIFSDNMDNNINLINKEIKDLNDYYNNLIENFKEKAKKYFKRALLEIEMNNF